MARLGLSTLPYRRRWNAQGSTYEGQRSMGSCAGPEAVRFTALRKCCMPIISCQQPLGVDAPAPDAEVKDQAGKQVWGASSLPLHLTRCTKQHNL